MSKRLLLMAAMSLVPAAGLFAQKPPTYDATFTLPDGPVTGTATMSIDARGKVTGTFAVPKDGVEGRLSGTVAKGVWTVEMAYTMAGRTCDGAVTGTADVSTDRKKVSGKISIGGSCTRPEKPATFVFALKDKSF